MLSRLHCSAATSVAVSLTKPRKVGFGVAVAELELVEGAGELPLGAGGDGEAFSKLPFEDFSVCAGVLFDGGLRVSTEGKSPFHFRSVFDSNACHGEAG